jgi:OmpA-OmpF porin, OOP family
MGSLLDSLKTQITPNLIQGLASNTGESSGAIEKALQGSAAAILTTLASRAQDTGFLSQIMNMISSFTTRGANVMGAAAGASSAAVASTVSSASQMDFTFLNTLFGSNLAGIQSKISEFAGVSGSTAGRILSATAPLVLGTLASRVHREGLNAGGLSNLLASEMPSLRSLLPAGLSIPGLSGVTSRASQVAEDVRPTTPKWLAPTALIALAILALLWFTSRNRPAVDSAVNTAQQAGSAVASGVASLGAFIKTALPGGIELNIPENGMESKLLAYIKDPNAPVSEQTWFEFDRLKFDTGSANLQASSQEQLQNIANILKAYPNVHVRIGGYTDNQGSPTSNLKLSQDRADTVRGQLDGFGVDASRTDAKGYGEDHPVADNMTEEGRAQNRRIALRVTQK